MCYIWLTTIRIFLALLPSDLIIFSIGLYLYVLHEGRAVVLLCDYGV